MARKRPTASDASSPALTCIDGGRPDDEGVKLTPAEREALRRCAPLTHARLAAHLRPIARKPPPPREA